ncbi:MAG: EF-P lysine aminoacylase EpmA [Chlamydiota bacterium]|jgi:lysyl-tRNA synthetase class 2
MSLGFDSSLTCKIDLLEKRAAALKKARQFFENAGYIEVDCPSLVKRATIDQHIDPIETELGFLHTSPEYLMKRLVAAGMNKIYQIGHVFRKGEIGKKHNPEFTMIEWYHTGFAYEEMIKETLEFLQDFLGTFEIKILSYQDLFINFLQIDPLHTNLQGLQKAAELNEVSIDDNLDFDGWLNLLFSHVIEPNMVRDTYYVITDFPPSQAALSKIVDGKAKRFEIFFQKMELANGYFELTDQDEHIRRFEKENFLRQQMGKKTYPLDEKLLASIEKLPDCSGVSVGFDRLLMLSSNQDNIESVLPFSFDQL